MADETNYDLSDIEERLMTKVSQCQERWCSRLCELWREMGLDQDTTSERIDSLSKHLDKIWGGIIEEEDGVKAQMTDIVDSLAREIGRLSEELQVAPFEPPPDATLYKLNKLLPIEHKKLKTEKTERLREIQDLLVMDDELADRLGEDAIGRRIDRNQVPSRDDLREAKQHIAELRAELIKRQAEFEEYRSFIVELLEDLGDKPRTNFESDLFGNDENAYDLSEDNLKALRHYREELEATQTDRRAAIEVLRKRFVLLWDRLAFDEDEKRQILEENNTCKLSVVDNFKKQIHRLEELRIANLECFTSKIRDEIRGWWDKCYFSDEQRQEFSEIESDEFNESLLDVHETEVARLREFYDGRLKVFLALENWHQLREQKIEFDKRANDPGRFSRRGGGLLQEEKERKKFAKNLPKFQKTVEDEISAWENENDDAFLLLGFTVQDYFKHVEEEEKEARLRRRRGDAADSAPAPAAGESGFLKPKTKTPTKRRFGNVHTTPTGSQVKSPTKRMKGDDVTLPRSATFTKSPVTSNGNLAATSASAGRARIPNMTLTDVVPPPHPGSSRIRSARSKTPKHRVAKEGSKMTAANSDDVLNGNAAVSYEDFKSGVTHNHRSSSLSDLRHFAASSGVNCRRNSENLDSPVDVELPILDAKSFREADF